MKHNLIKKSIVRGKKRSCRRMGDAGSAMVVVIIAMAFIGILASVLMYTSMLNYQMKINNLKAKDNFYSAETVLDEIRMGILKEVSLSIQDAYQLILTGFEGSSSKEKQYRMRYRFLSSLQEKYKAGSDTNSYDLRVLFGYLEKTYGGTVLETSYGGVEYSVMRRESDGVLVDKNGNEITDANIPRGAMVLYSDGLSFKDLKVTYTDDSGYVSIIETDLRVSRPDMEFAEAVSLPALTNYSLVAQNRINVGPDSGVSTNTIRGCFYGEGMYVGTASPAVSPAIVTLNLQEDVSNYNSDKRMVVAENLYVGQGSRLSTDRYGELWARNIVMNGKSASGSACEIDFGGNDVYVANDLEINGEDNEFSAGVQLAEGGFEGQYIGFGAGDGTGESSSIIINGTGTELYLDKLNNLTLAGNTYVGISSTASGLDGTEGVYNESDLADVLMGQSIAVKSDQVAYLVPAECIGVYKENGQRVKDNLTNPMTIEDYQAYIAKYTDTVDEVRADIRCSALGGKSLSDYGIVTDGAHPMYQRYFKRVNSKITLVYYYVMFDSTDDTSVQNANQYFADYYHANKSTMDAYSKLYTKNIEMRDAANGFYTLHLAGNVVHYDTGAQPELHESTAASDATNAGYQIQLTTNQAKFTALCKKLIDSYDQLSAAERAETSNVYTNLVNISMINGYFSNVDSDTAILDKGKAIYFGDTDVKAVVVKGDYIYTGSGNDRFKGLIIATGNVEINDDFDGTVLCGGDITLGRDVTVQPDKTSVLRALTYTNVVNGYEYHVTDFLIGGSGYLSGSGKTYDNSNIDLGDLIVYENWQKQ